MIAMPTILFVGGGSLGHVIPSIAIAQAVKKIRPDCSLFFVCADRFDETTQLKNAGLRFHPLRAPKSPPLFSFAFLIFPLRFLAACLHARAILVREKPDIVFSKGGCVSVPVCLMAALRGIPIVMHESDSVASASTRLLARVADVICTGFPDIDLPAILKEKIHHTGNPVRAEIAGGSNRTGQRITGFSGRRPVVMILGGSQGSVALNEAVTMSLPALTQDADILHLTGAGKMTAASHARYFVRTSVGEGLPHLYALADVVISRAGVGVLSELAALHKAVIVVPLTGVGHDHQLMNAEFLQKTKAIILLPQQNLPRLVAEVHALLQDDNLRRDLGESLHRSFLGRAAEKIAEIILAEAEESRIQS